LDSRIIGSARVSIEYFLQAGSVEMKCLSVSVGIVVLLVFQACCVALNAAEENDPLMAIKQANVAFAAAFATGDGKAVAGMYTDNGKLYPPNSGIVEGRAAIGKFWNSVMAQGISQVELTAVEIESFGDSLVESGTAKLFGKDGMLLDNGKYLVLWKKVGGHWKMHRDCWNSSQPPPKN
jgi:ketosteroid isomerase-like protein